MADSLRMSGGIVVLIASLTLLGAWILPTGDAGITVRVGDEDRTTTETYEFLGLEIDRPGTTPDGSGQWFEAGYDGTGGITYLRAAPIIMAVGLVLLLIAGVLALAPASQGSWAPGIVAAVGWPLALAGTVVHYSGLRLHIQGTFGVKDWPQPEVGFWLLLAALLVGLAGVILCFLRSAEEARTAPSKHRAAPPAPAGPSRSLRCPRCQSVNQVAGGAVPVCRSCGFTA